MDIPGIGKLAEDARTCFTFLEKTSDGIFQKGKEGVQAIFTPLDKKAEFIVFQDKPW